MADFLNNITNKIPLPNNPQESLGKFADAASQIPGNFNIPKIPNPNDALKGLEGKIPNKELADKAAAKFKELQDKFNKLKKTKVNIKKPKAFKPKEIPVPKKFKKAELDKLKGLSDKANSLKSQATGLADKAKDAAAKAKDAAEKVKNQAQGLASQAQGLTSQIQGVVSQAQNAVTNASSGIQSGLGNALNQIGLPNK